MVKKKKKRLFVPWSVTVLKTKLKKNPIGTEPALKVGTHCKPTQMMLRRWIPHGRMKECDCEGPVDNSMSIIYSP